MTWNVLTDDGKIKSKFLDIDQEIIEGLISEINELGDQMNRTTNVQGSMTSYKTATLYFLKLQEIIKENLDFKIVDFVDFWGHILRGQDHILPHTHEGMKHPEQYASFVFYLDTSNGSGELYFPTYDLELIPQNNLLVLFDVDVVHEVLPNHDPNISRISAAGNLKILEK